MVRCAFRLALPLALLAACSPAPASERGEPGAVAFPAIPGGLDPVSINSLPASEPVLHEAFGTASPRQTGDLRLPPASFGKGPYPVAMLVHGGCWTAGLGSPRNMDALATWLAQHGVATWNVDYRELGDGGGWPGSFEDWAAAARHLAALATRFPLDLKRLSVLGHSAGATAGLFLARPPAPDGPLGADAADWPRPAVIVQLDGLVPDPYLLDAGGRMCGPVIEAFMGGDPSSVPARFHAIMPHNAPPRVAKVLIVSAVLPPPPADGLAALGSAGAKVEVIESAPRNHFDILAPGTPAFAALAPTLLAATGAPR